MQLPNAGDSGETISVPSVFSEKSTDVADAFGYQLQSLKSNSSRKRQPKEKIMNVELDNAGPYSNSIFQGALNNDDMTFIPNDLNFMPSNYWATPSVTFNYMVHQFFQRKNNANCRFPHKLYNALSIVDRDPEMFNLIGVRWLTDSVFLIDKLLFGRLLGISSIDGALFHGQGNFPTHGFGEVSNEKIMEIRESCDDLQVDHDRIRVLEHRNGMFTRGSDEDIVTRCKWSQQK